MDSKTYTVDPKLEEAAASEMPETIWAGRNGDDGGLWDVDPHYVITKTTKYIRADLADKWEPGTVKLLNFTAEKLVKEIGEHKDIGENHEAGLIPMATQKLLSKIALILSPPKGEQ